MNISFRKAEGIRALGIAFFWMMTIDEKSPLTIKDYFIPELFFDYFLVKTGQVQCLDKALRKKFNLSRQSLKTLYTHPLTFVYSTPLVLFGARLTLGFAETFPEEMNANCFLEQAWAGREALDLGSFKTQVVAHVKGIRRDKFPYPVLLSDLEESHWLANFSPRHKRRLYKTAFGLSRKELQNINNIHNFLEQTCDFASQNPRIIRHVNPGVFYDQPHLNHIFRKIAGLSPVEYFQTSSILQNNLMAASYNEFPEP